MAIFQSDEDSQAYLQFLEMKPKNILLTGPPRCGESTLIERLIQQIDKPLTGFFTREMSVNGFLSLIH